MRNFFPFYKQPESMDCGATCLRMIAKYYGKNYPLSVLCSKSYTTREGASLLGLSEAAESIGLHTLAVKVDYKKLLEEIPLPCIAHWNQNHFVVIYKIKKDKIFIADPAHGLLTYTKQEFLKQWVSEANNTGILLLLDPMAEFYSQKDADDLNDKSNTVKGFSFLFRYLSKHRKLIVQLLLGLLGGSLLQLIFPFLTQSIVDVGIQNHDIGFIYLILMAQLMVFFGRTMIDIIRGWVLIHMSTRINISLVSDFFIKLMRLPISFFDVKMTGDIMQRILDHEQIESFLTGPTFNTLFSFFNLIVLGAVIAWYNTAIFAVFVVGSVFYFIWIVFFLKRRADLNYKLFSQHAQNQSTVMELINGMQEIKLHNAERQKRWKWENIQIKLFKTNLKNLALNQWQSSGSGLINELKNIIITFLSAKLVLEGKITLGMMLSISYIIGQLNAPLLDFVNFIHQWQDAKLSLERLSEIHGKADEEPVDKEYDQDMDVKKDIVLKDISFKYDALQENFILEKLNLIVPANKVTAIVGTSGSGKTTLMKLLLKFYEPDKGTISVGQQNLKNYSSKAWRGKCGSVMQEGFIFNDTIAANIAVGDDEIDKKRLKYAAHIANIKEFIETLPLGYNTKIGMEGVGLSTGQKQRILIARAVYKNPDILFFDEATSALDANNEKTIMNNLTEFFQGKTVVIIAHRLSTVKNADQIVVLDKGKIVEFGHHNVLANKKGFYYELVKNQLELGN